MKTLGYIDKADPSGKIVEYVGEDGISKDERIRRAYEDLRHMGNILLVYIRGSKARVVGDHYGPPISYYKWR